jgi:hypothetical protein
MGDADAYREAIARVAMFALVDLLEHPWHLGLSHDKNPDGPTLYRTVTATALGITRMHVTRMMWRTATTAADAVVTQLDVVDEPPHVDVDLRTT